MAVATLQMSTEDLADRANIHRTSIGGIERGERNSTLTMIQRLARALGVTRTTLLEPAEAQEGQEEE
jgi:transcriptional regulator with XRE-family HTH domain